MNTSNFLFIADMKFPTRMSNSTPNDFLIGLRWKLESSEDTTELGLLCASMVGVLVSEWQGWSWGQHRRPENWLKRKNDTETCW